jgi:hypothetical protein
MDWAFTHGRVTRATVGSQAAEGRQTRAAVNRTSPALEPFSGLTAGTIASPAVRRSSDSVDQLGFA